MKFQDLIKIYEEKRSQYGKEVVNHISEIFTEAKEIHKKDWLKKPTKGKDHEQSWRAFKGKNLEKLAINFL